MLATGDLGEAAFRKTPSSDDELEKSAKLAVGFGFDGLPLGPELEPRSRELASWITCPMSVSTTSEALRLGFDFGKALSTLFNAQIGSDNLAFRLTLTFTLGTAESSEGRQLELDCCITYVLATIGFT